LKKVLEFWFFLAFLVILGDIEHYWGNMWVILGNIGVILGDIGQYWVILGNIG
jgi:hypothetical protein